MAKREIIRSTKSRIDELGGGGTYDWRASWGPESIYQYLIPQVKPGDTVLDLCSGVGRASLPLAMHRALVTAVDTSAENLEELVSIFKQHTNRPPHKILVADVKTLSPPQVGKFNFVIACNAITHFTKTEAVKFIAKLPEFLARKRPSYLYVDGPSRMSYQYDVAREYFPDSRVDFDTYEDECGCSGEMKLEPIPYFTPGEIELTLRSHGGIIVYTHDIEVPHSGAYNREVIARFN